jgi:hypothetical protein
MAVIYSTSRLGTHCSGENSGSKEILREKILPKLWLFSIFLAFALFSCICCAFPTKTAAAITLVQTAQGGGTTGTITANFAATPTQDNLLIAIAATRLGGNINTPSGWSVAIKQDNSGGFAAPNQTIFYRVAGASESSTVIVTTTASGNGTGLHIYEYSGTSTSSPLDGNPGSNSGSSHPISTGNVTNTSFGNDLLIAGVVSTRGNSLTGWTNGFAEEKDFTGGAGGAQTLFGGADLVGVPSPNGTQVEFNYAGGADWRGQIAAFKDASPTAVKLISFTAAARGEGVLLQWRTGYEVDNLGFHIYREENYQRIRVNPELIKGSALLAGGRTETAGHSYTLLDILPEGAGQVQYWLEDVELSGKKTVHGPFLPALSQEPLSKRIQAALLSHLSKRQAEEDPAVPRAQALQARLGRRMAHLHETPSPQSFLPLRSENRTPREVQWMLAAGPAMRFFIQEAGWYRVTQPHLVAAGMNPRINPRYLQLFVEGVEQPMVVRGEKDGRFGPQDFIEFYGTGLDTPFTESRVYWLAVGSRPGKRVEKVASSSKGRGGPASFPFTVEEKPRMIYFAALLNGDAENFFGPLVSTTPLDQILKVGHLDAAPPGDAALEVALQGASDGAHRVKILLNEVEVGSLVFEGRSQGKAQVVVSQAGLREGENRVTLLSQGGETDVSLVDFIRLTYWHTYTADQDTLRFTATGGEPLWLDGFSRSRVRVVDITDPHEVQEVAGVVKAQRAGFGLGLQIPGQGRRTLWAFTEERVEKPAAVEANQPSGWHQAGQGVDLVMISHKDFLESLQPLKALREAQGWSVELIDVEDLYDEFSFGTKTPQALRDFLGRARSHWQKPPRFVLLVGDASVDPRNYLGMGNFDFVPTKLIDTAYLETASDDWFVDFDGDGIPDMAIGRLPVHTLEEVQTVVSKVIAYEQSGTPGKEVLLVADLKGEDFDFEGASEELAGLLPSGLSFRKIFRGQFRDDVQVKSELLKSLNEGPSLVNYLGHGSVELWRGGVFDSEDAEGLLNGGKLSFFVSLTCLNGFFQDSYTHSLGETLLKADKGGAVVVWASSGLTDPGGQKPMNQELFRLLFKGESITIGEAVARAKAATSDRDVRRTWILFGDPVTRLKY